MNLGTTFETAKTRVYVVLLNWNGWKNTVECLESLFRNDYENYRVVVCDNDSSDDSIKQLCAWAEGKLVFGEVSSPLRWFSYPPVTKPIPISLYKKKEAEAGGEKDKDTPLTIIRTGGNLGFAGGCNVGLRYMLARDDGISAWLLNNDTVVAPDALSELVRRMREEPDAGICGSTIRFYYSPEHIQAMGGAHFNPWFCKIDSIGAWRKGQEGMAPQKVEKK